MELNDLVSELALAVMAVIVGLVSHRTKTLQETLKIKEPFNLILFILDNRNYNFIFIYKINTVSAIFFFSLPWVIVAL